MYCRQTEEIFSYTLNCHIDGGTAFYLSEKESPPDHEKIIKSSKTGGRREGKRSDVAVYILR